MTQQTSTNSRTIWLICITAIAIILFRALRSLPHLAEIMASADNDDLMRMVEVRDWLAGQSWFDTHQYRVLPPDGISLHWSRYVDAGIALFLVPASWILPQAQAELAAMVLWPTLLACLMALLLGHGTGRLFGPAGAIGALAVFLGWFKLGAEFTVTRIDHHSLQMLGATTVFYLSLLPGRPRILGALAGVATALTLAVGLEMLPFLALTWGVMLLRNAFREAGADDWLLGYCAALAIAAPLLLAGQTRIEDWWVIRCDFLAPPVLGLAAVGIAVSLASVLSAKIIRHPALRILLMLVVAGLGLWLAAPILSPCAAGPYALAAPEVRIFIETQVPEARSAALLIATDPALLGRVMLPPVVITLFALITLLRSRGLVSVPQVKAAVLAVLSVFLGLCFALYQMRAANLATPAVPLLAGFLTYAFTLIPRSSPRRVPAVLLLLLAMPTVVERIADRIPVLVGAVLAEKVPTGQSSAGGFDLTQNCRNTEAMAELATIPETTLFSSFFLGSAILFYTPHSVASAGYHRSAEAFWNGLMAFQSADNLRIGLARSKADYLVVCSTDGEDSALPYLRMGAIPDWLADVSGDRKYLRIFKVDRDALAQAGSAP